MRSLRLKETELKPASQRRISGGIAEVNSGQNGKISIDDRRLGKIIVNAIMVTDFILIQISLEIETCNRIRAGKPYLLHGKCIIYLFLRFLFAGQKLR